MKNPLKTWRERRQQKKADKANRQYLSDLAFRERTLNQLERANMIAWNARRRQLFITQSLATLFLTDAERWVSFIRNVHDWLYLRLCSDAWEQFIQQEELKAVREALTSPTPCPSPKGLGGTAPQTPTSINSPRPFRGGVGGGANLSRMQIDAIKTSRRREIALDDMEPPKVEPFEFFIIPLSTAAEVEPIGVGYYDPNTGQMDVATWDEVKSLLQEATKK